MTHEESVRVMWEAWSQGDFEALETALTPEAQWRAVEDGPWNCRSRTQILQTMRENRALGRVPSGEIAEITDLGERTLVGFRPDRQPMDGWPLDNGVRYMVLTFHGDLVGEMKGCASRQVALDYASA
jgi:ketosteroid isomerase-like protein